MLSDASGRVIEAWTLRDLSIPGSVGIHNDFAYNKFKVSPFGISAEMGAGATMSLPAGTTQFRPEASYRLILKDVEGRIFTASTKQIGHAVT